MWADISGKSSRKTSSRLVIASVEKSDSGNYTCSTTNAEPSTISVYVSEGGSIQQTLLSCDTDTAVQWMLSAELTEQAIFWKDRELFVFWRVKFIPIIYYRTIPDLKCMSGCFYKFTLSQTFCPQHTPLLHNLITSSKLPIGPICNPNCPVGAVLKFSQDYSVFRRQDPQSSRWCSFRKKALWVPDVFDADDSAPLNCQAVVLIEPSHSPSPQDSVIAIEQSIQWSDEACRPAVRPCRNDAEGLSLQA